MKRSARIESPDGFVDVLEERGGLVLAVGSAGVLLTLRLSDDDGRQLVAVVERELRTRAAARRLDPAAACRCGHPRGVHQDGEGACRDDKLCPCLVMRPPAVVPVALPRGGAAGPATVQSCTVPAVPSPTDQPVYPYSVLRRVSLDWQPLE